MSDFRQKLFARMERTGETYHQACRAFGGAGGRQAAKNKRLARFASEKFHEEQKRQVAMGLRTADELSDNLTEQDRVSIAMDQRKRRVE